MVENATDPVKPFVYKYHVRVPDTRNAPASDSSSSRDIFHKGIDALFSAGTRRYPIYFHFPWSRKTRSRSRCPKVTRSTTPIVPAPINVGEICKHEINMGVTKDQTQLIYKRNFSSAGRDRSCFQ